MLSQLTIGMVSEAVDERTVAVRETAGKGRTLLRLGNVAAPERGALDEAAHAAKLTAARETLEKLLGKQMIWWKAAAQEFQPPQEAGPDKLTLADVWTIEGKHVNGFMREQGHLAAAEEYQEELAKNILTAEADDKKQDAYKELAEALKESERAKAKEAAEARKAEVKKVAKQEEEKAQGLGLSGWIGLLVVVALVAGVMTNFGRGGKKTKTNLNRKRGPLERFWQKLKGA